MITRTMGMASCVALLGCRQTPAQLPVSPDGVEPVADEDQTCTPSVAPKPPPGSADDRDPPVILAARFVARNRVELTFSEALAPTESVNPRQFRLGRVNSRLEATNQTRVYATGYYYDLAGADAYQQQLVVVELELDAEHPETLTLTLSTPIPHQVCEDLEDSKLAMESDEAGPRGRVGLFLHYTSRGSDGVRDRVGNPMTDLGADWALHFGARFKQVHGTEPVMRLDLLPELECPKP